MIKNNDFILLWKNRNKIFSNLTEYGLDTGMDFPKRWGVIFPTGTTWIVFRTLNETKTYAYVYSDYIKEFGELVAVFLRENKND